MTKDWVPASRFCGGSPWRRWRRRTAATSNGAEFQAELHKNRHIATDLSPSCGRRCSRFIRNLLPLLADCTRRSGIDCRFVRSGFRYLKHQTSPPSRGVVSCRVTGTCTGAASLRSPGETGQGEFEHETYDVDTADRGNAVGGAGAAPDYHAAAQSPDGIAQFRGER